MGILRDPPSVFKGTISYKYFFVELVKPFLRTNVRTHERLNEENLSRELGVAQIEAQIIYFTQLSKNGSQVG